MKGGPHSMKDYARTLMTASLLFAAGSTATAAD